MTRSVLFVTGTRADFGKLEPLAIKCRDSGFAVSFFVTGMHMLERYGLTKLEVHRVAGVTVHEYLNQREGDPQDMVLAKTIVGFSDYLTEARPDLVVIHGDRVEALAASLVCATNYVRSAHIEGGEVSGTIDEVFRHCNSKLGSHHFVSSQEAARRVMALGEPEEAIHVIGSPELDFHSRPSGVSLAEVKNRYAIPFEQYGVVVFHPVTSEAESMGEQAQSLFDALEASGKHFVLIAPNNDPGSASIQKVISSLPQDRFRTLPSMRFSHFSELLRNAAAMIGNSSAGVREAPFLGIPSLDVGSRQTNRAQADSIHHVSALDRDGIGTFLAQQWGLRYDRHKAFGEGSAADRFDAVLKTETFWSVSLQKAFNDYE